MGVFEGGSAGLPAQRSSFGLKRFAKCLMVSVCLGSALAAGAQTAQPAIGPHQAEIVKAGQAAGATSLVATPTADGGLRLNGLLGGRQFALVIPSHWNKQVVLFAHGYSQPGTPVAVAENPLENDLLGIYRTPYAEGFAVGHSAYAKAGMGVQTGVESTLALKKFANALGATRAYLIGASMGGDIAVASVEKYPGEYAGAIAACGAVGGWRGEVGWLMDVRASYNYFTRGTAYEMPGEKSITKSALPAPSADASGQVPPAALMLQLKQIATPVLGLFAAAQKNPGGAEDRIIDNVAAVAGTVKDPAGFGLPLVTTALGQDDMNAAFGGSIYDNTHKVYSSPLLSASQNAALNQGIERVQADPAALANADAWYTPTGRFDAKLLSMYNEVDPLVPSRLHELPLLRAAEAAGNTGNLLERSVPSMTDPNLIGSGLSGLRHCGFTPEQVSQSFNDLRSWVETGKKPAQ